MRPTLPFIDLVSCLLATRGDTHLAYNRAVNKDLDARVVAALKDLPSESVIKAAVAAGTTSSDAALIALQSLQSDWFATLRSQSLLDALLSESRSIPQGYRFGIQSGVITGGVGTEANWFPISKGSFTVGDPITPQHALAIIVITEELAQFGAPAGLRLIDQELRNAVSRAGDVAVVAALLDGLTPIASAGDFRTDLQAAFAAVPLDQTSKPMIFTTPALIAQVALLGGDSGSGFPDLAIPGGGSISGVPAMGIDALHTGGADGDMLLVIDANRTGGSAGALELFASRNASLQMTDNASGTSPANTVSMFETNSIAMRAGRFFNFGKSTVDAAAAIKNITTVSA